MTESIRFHQWEHPLDRRPIARGYFAERRCAVCGVDEYSAGPQSSECPGTTRGLLFSSYPLASEAKFHRSWSQQDRLNALLDVELGLS